MAHNINKVLFGTHVSMALITITAYVQGGESFTLAEFGLSGTLQSLFFLSTTGFGNTEAQCKYMGAGVVKLLDPAAIGIGEELAANPSMSFQFLAVVTVVGA